MIISDHSHHKLDLDWIDDPKMGLSLQITAFHRRENDHEWRQKVTRLDAEQTEKLFRFIIDKQHEEFSKSKSSVKVTLNEADIDKLKNTLPQRSKPNPPRHAFVSDAPDFDGCATCGKHKDDPIHGNKPEGYTIGP